MKGEFGNVAHLLGFVKLCLSADRFLNFGFLFEVTFDFSSVHYLFCQQIVEFSERLTWHSKDWCFWC